RPAPGPGRGRAGGGEAGAARALAARAAAGAGGPLPRPRRGSRAAADAIRDPDPAGAVRQQCQCAGDVGFARTRRLLGGRDPPADRARRPGAAARHLHRRARAGAGRCARRRPGRGPRPRRRPVAKSHGMTASGVQGRVALAAVGLALLSALFFTMTYVLNRASASGGGHWAWLACLRYLITLPLMLPLMLVKGGTRPVLQAIAAHPRAWLRCAGIGFGLFYVLLSYADSTGPSWLVAGSFQFTVIAGMLCAPLLYRDARRRIPPAGLAVAGLILAGVLLMQFGHASGALDRAAWIALACVLVSAVAYPLGNRLLLLHLERSGEPLDATQRVFGLTLASQPMWLLLAAYAALQAGPPTLAHVGLAAGVAMSSGVIATNLFFQATGMVRDQPLALGAVEAMQGAEVVFAVLLGVLLLGEDWPTGTALLGAAVVVAGIVAFAWVVARPAAVRGETRALRTDKGA